MNRTICISPELSVQEAITILVDGGKKVVFIVAQNMKLLGIMTNGDMRKFLLTGQPLTAPVRKAMNPTPKVFTSAAEIEAQKRKQPYIVYPIVNREGLLIDAVYAESENPVYPVSDELNGVPLVIMAGGMGTRLYPYTKILPKAILPIGQYSITERIIQSFQKCGCNQVYMVLNHKASVIKAYMSEIDTGCEIHYVKEETFSGTAGGLYLLKEHLNSTFILSNCDILIDDDLGCAYKTHKAQKNQITYICSMMNQTIPYGVIETSEDGQIRKISEKPQFSFLVNTGVYILEPEVLDEISPGESIHITDLTERCVKKGMRAGVFPVSERSWLDMGQIEEMKQMIQRLEPEY